MILNLYLTQNYLKVKEVLKVWFCGGCAWKFNYYNIKVTKDLESLTVISVEHYCKINPVWFKC